MRLFVGVWPPPAVLDALEGVPRLGHPALRWTTRDQRHVTLRFLGAVDPADLAPLVSSLEEGLATCTAAEAVLGPETSWLGRSRRSPLVVPVSGVEPLAAAVVHATRGIGEPADRPFRGHLTLARVRRGCIAPGHAASGAVAGSWLVDRVAVVRSELDPNGARYQTLAELPLPDAATTGR